MLGKLLSQITEKYTVEHLKELEQAESLFRYTGFTAKDALALGTQIVHEAEKCGEGIAVRIVRISDNLPIFQYVDNDRNGRNLEFARMKANVAELTEHSSLWSLVNAAVIGDDPYGLEKQADCLPVGGAFPIFAGDELCAIVMVSGLHHGYDHQVIVDARCAVLGCEAPAFHGTMI